ncbi:DUF748 domain-containing protein [Isoalcanivorax beigongshangi]|uniref:DUF748 domain-containing protein n=1 Tax=Isoalcanivorax beigongshangi TaxID=3238810 RepID=A0ABV4AJA3_9GAMM
MSLSQRWRSSRRSTRIALIVAVLYLLYAALTAWVLAPWLQRTLIEELGAATGRDVSLTALDINPFTLSARAQEFALHDPDGTPFVAFDGLEVNFQLSSLLRRSWHFKSLVLTTPRVTVTQLQRGQFNFADLLERFADDPDASDEPAAPVKLPPLSVARIEVADGGVHFIDRAYGGEDKVELSPVSFVIHDFSTRAASDGDDNSYQLAITSPGGGSLDWQGRFLLDPFQADGQLTLRNVELAPFAELLRHQLRFTLAEGSLDLDTRYQVDGSDPLRIQLQDGQLTLNRLRLDDPEQQLTVLALPRLALSGITVDTLEQRVAATELALEQPRLVARLQQQGLDLVTLFTPIELPEDEKVAVVQVTPADERSDAAPEREWTLTLASLQLQQGAVALTDHTLAEPAALSLAPIDVTLGNLVVGAAEPFTLAAKLALDGGGSVSAEGGGTLVPFSTDLSLALEALPVTTLQPWLAPHLDAALQSGTAEGKWTLKLADGEPLQVTLRGDARINDLALLEQGRLPLLALKQLTLSGLSLDLAAQRLALARIGISGLDVQARISPDGRNPADRILRDSGSTNASDSGAPWQVQIEEIAFDNSRARYLDRSMSPNFSVALTRLQGSLRQLDSDGRRPVQVALQGRVDDHAPLSVQGTLSPLAAQPTAQLTTRLQGYDMTSLTPFTGQYLGYTTDTGQLSLDSTLTVDGTRLDSQTQVKALKFFLGDRVNSPDALNVPIKLGLSVIRDRHDLIELPVKAAGDLSDPSVSVRGIVLKALTNILVRAATSPLSVLAGLVGGSDLEQVPFSAGAAAPNADTERQLADLAKALEQRPQLMLTLEGQAGDADRLALSAEWLGRDLEGRNWAELDTAASDSGFQRRVLRRYQRELDADPQALLPDDSDSGRDTQVRAAFDALAAHLQTAVNDDLLLNLAQQRAQQVKTLLMDQYGIAGERLQQSSAKLAAADAPRVALTLSSR